MWTTIVHYWNVTLTWISKVLKKQTKKDDDVPENGGGNAPEKKEKNEV